MREETKYRFQRILYYVVLVSFLVPIVYLIVLIAIYDPETATRPRSDYSLMLVQCVLGVLVIHIPALFIHRWQIDIPVVLHIMYIVFLYCAIFLGEIASFYYYVPHWDDILHAMSSVMTGFFAYMLIAILNHGVKIRMALSPFFVALFAFCFSVTIGAVWEIYEFVADYALGLNMQKFITSSGEVLIGQAALADTMKDLIVDSVGALAASLIGLFSLHRKGWVHAYLRKDVRTVKQRNGAIAELSENL
ncbi:MAG: hypothetical protein IJ009_06480 [Clostridia bacterium]|nr:hypothetical protein [Clostridia bacterium]